MSGHGRKSAGVSKFARDRGGNIALISAIAACVLVGGGAMSLDFVSGTMVRQNLQNAADGAALAAATELALRTTSESTVDAVVEGYARNNVAKETDLTVIDASIIDDRSGVSVDLAARAPYMFAAFFGAEGDREVRAHSRARLANAAPLCALALEERRGRAVFLESRARIIAPDCAVVSNSRDPRGIVAADSSELRATMICSAGGAYGRGANFSPDPITDCPAVPDPLANRPEPHAGGCDHLLKLSITGARTLSPGVYCGGMTILPGATIRLRPGIYVMKNGPLLVMNNARLIGEHVGFYFVGDLSSMTLSGGSHIELTAPRDGPMAGFLFFANRVLLTGDLNLRRFRVESNDARTLLGTIYLRDGVFEAASQRPIADRSSYTVIVARRIEVTSGPDLVLNADYDRTDVPVPDGVGPREPTAFLDH